MDQWKNHGVKGKLDEEMIAAGCTPEVVCLASDQFADALMVDASRNDDEMLGLYDLMRRQSDSYKRDPAP